MRSALLAVAVLAMMGCARHEPPTPRVCHVRAAMNGKADDTSSVQRALDEIAAGKCDQVLLSDRDDVQISDVHFRNGESGIYIASGGTIVVTGVECFGVGCPDDRLRAGTAFP